MHVQGVAAPNFRVTAGALDFHWGDDTGKLIEALITFLYLGMPSTLVIEDEMMSTVHQQL